MNPYEDRQSNYELEIEIFKQHQAPTLPRTQIIPLGLRERAALVIVMVMRGLWTLLRALPARKMYRSEMR